jgi:eukaryotic-like serine/threonine-protein kinase
LDWHQIDRTNASLLLSTMQPGQLLCDRYRVEKALAAGGFGETFLAVDTHLPSKPQVVVKLLKPINSDPGTLKIAQRLFNTEAETLERLGKDNDLIPSLYAYFELRGEFYLVQEYIAGTTLTGELQGRKILESDTLDILKEILTGLTKVHSQNIIHRDLKPDNIIRRGIDRKLVLIDFGAVKQVRAATVTTPNPSVSRTIGIGTEGYMPSEQGIGYPKPASDIYAVGAIAIQCLTGSAPHLLFDEDSLKLEWQHLRKVNRDLAQVLNKMVATDYRQRYANATEALKAIESLIAPSAPPQIPPPPIPIPTPVIPTVPTKPVVRSPPPQPFKSPINQGVKPPSPKPIQQPVNKQVKTPSRGIDRRNFFKWLGFGGVGTVSFLALSQIVKNSSTKTLPTANILSQSGTPPKLTKIQFTSVKLNKMGEIVDKPTGNAEIFTENLGNGIGLTMVKIPAGKFLMGAPFSERTSPDTERPQHKVNIPGFYLSQTLVTQAQWVALMGKNPSMFEGSDKLPIEMVSWLEAMHFCQKLIQKTGRTYRLPSEAEWEYACRAGTTTYFTFGDRIMPMVANYRNYSETSENHGRSKTVSIDVREMFKEIGAKAADGTTTPVDSFPPNLFGLYDMHGNLQEWCLDEWVDNYNGSPNDGSARGDISLREDKKRLVRGGGWNVPAMLCRSASRFSNPGGDNPHGGKNMSGGSNLVGFRVVYIPSRTS